MRIQSVRPVARYAHGEEHFTEGLLVHGGLVLESIGNCRHLRMIYRVPPYLVEVARYEFSGEFFAECLCPAPDGWVLVLGFRENQAVLWNVEAGRAEGTLAYDREGWGICALGDDYYTTDGSSTLVRRRHDLSLDPPVNAGVRRVGHEDAL